MKIVVGIDIGGTKTKLGLVCKKGLTHIETSFPTTDYPLIDDFIKHLSKTISDLLNDKFELLGIGIGAPNASSKNGTIENAANLKWKGVVEVVEKLNVYFDIPIKIMNDASAAALGEKIFGSAKEMDDFITITLGTGLGGGIVANGKLIDGFDGFAGELGHIDITLGDGRLTGLGVKGGLEAYVSVTGIKRTVYHMLCKYTEASILREYSYKELDGETIYKAALDGDFIAQKTYNYTGKVLGGALANFVAFTQPEAIFLTGGLLKSGVLLLEPTRKHLEKNLLQVYKGKVKLLESGLTDRNPAVLGAASLIWNEN